MPTPPVNAVASSTIITLRCVRWLIWSRRRRCSGRNQRTDDAGLFQHAEQRSLDRPRTPRVEQHPHPHAVPRTRRRARCANSRPMRPSQYTKVRKSIVLSASSIAASIAGKISSPLRSTSTRLPSVAGTPMTPSSVRRYRDAIVLGCRARTLRRASVTSAAPASATSCRLVRLGVFDLLDVLRRASVRRGPLRAARRPRRRTAPPPPRAATTTAARPCRRAVRTSGRTTCSSRRTR